MIQIFARNQKFKSTFTGDEGCCLYHLRYAHIVEEILAPRFIRDVLVIEFIISLMFMFPVVDDWIRKGKTTVIYSE